MRPVIPVPTDRNLLNWAHKMVAYLRGVESEMAMPSPKVLQLEHSQAGAKAVKDGLMMWSPTDGTIIVSKSGTWHKVTIAPGGTP